MLRFKDLQNKIYSGKNCVRFECIVPMDKGFVSAEFNKIKENEWNMRIIFDRTRDKDSEVYNFGYVMPASNVPLELIAATGLKYFQLYLKEEVQKKSNLDFVLGNILQGM